MYAIVNIAGQQFKVKKDNKVFVHRLDVEEGGKIELNDILLLSDNDGKVTVGKPYVEGIQILATVISHQKGDKVLVFKKKRRKGYQKLNGHRQQFTHILIEDILTGFDQKSKTKKNNEVQEKLVEKAIESEQQEQMNQE
jgi:large subunit ribosomal protein L21